MDPFVLGIGGTIAAFALIALRVPIAFALGASALASIFLKFAVTSSGTVQMSKAVLPTMTLATSAIFDLFHAYSLTAIPMFIAVGHICYRAGITTDIYFAARVWLTRLPGGLAMASIMGCGGFSAISGSSLACAATMGRVAIPEMLRFGYSDRLASGAVAAGGTLGALIPPSILFILYGVFAEQSISKLFLAAVIPGLLSMAGYLIVIGIWASWRKKDAPPADEEHKWSDRMQAAAAAWPALLIFTIIIGGIYGGIFTATEAAAVSLCAATAIAFLTGRIKWAGFVDSIRETALQSSMIFLIAAAAKLFATFIALTGMASHLVAIVVALDPSALALMLGICLIYLILGMFLDPLGIMLLTLPFMLPLVELHGFDLIWFGVIVVKILEMGLLTPPVGLNVFVIHSVSQPKIPVTRIFVGVAPFFTMDLLVLGLLLAFPAISLWITL